MKSIVYLATVWCLASGVSANETMEIKFDALPKAVQRTVLKIVEKHHIYQIDRISDRRHVMFEIKSSKPVDKNNFFDTDITLAKNGRIIKLKKEVTVFALPFKVMKQITHLYPDIELDKVEATELRFFELTGTVKGQKLKFKILENGEIQELPVDPPKN